MSGKTIKTSASQEKSHLEKNSTNTAPVDIDSLNRNQIHVEMKTPPSNWIYLSVAFNRFTVD
ncbi:hypothetical protein [uncultured Deefgea sp.]|uniref:hypothetical protein n=1 Tax=uncultured Deefgea sp. TaxID=1304914 RepID=UPI002625F5F5|nr:hypothetical protein [uncultured Deefgea sp.]